MTTAQEYINSNKRIDGRRVSLEDIFETATWCAGEAIRAEVDGVYKTFVVIDDDTRAFIGDWILTNGETWVVFSDEEYRKVFVPIIHDREKFGKILELVKIAMSEAGADLVAHDGVDWPLIAENIATKLIQII